MKYYVKPLSKPKFLHCRNNKKYTTAGLPKLGVAIPQGVAQQPSGIAKSIPILTRKCKINILSATPDCR